MVSEEAHASVITALKAAGCRITPQRRAIVKEVMTQIGHINPADLAERVVKNLPGVHAATVYRTLWLLDELNILTHTHLEEGVAYHHSDQASHVHLVCSRCGRSEALEEPDVRSMAKLMRRTHGFSPDFTHFAISGLCKRCLARTPAAEEG